MFLTGAAQNYFVLKLADDVPHPGLHVTPDQSLLHSVVCKVGIHLDHPFHSWFSAAVVPVWTQARYVCYYTACMFCLMSMSEEQTQPALSLGICVLLADTTCRSETHATRIANNT